MPHSELKAPIKTPKDTRTPIVISYRIEGKDPGKGAFFDHYTVQKHTGFPTAITQGDDPRLKGDKYLRDYTRAQAIGLPHSPLDPQISKPLPPVIEYQTGGLLFIPGMTRDSFKNTPATHQVRMTFEGKIIKHALLTGRPILAVCAGSWTLYQALGGSITPVTDHAYGGGMPRIMAAGHVAYNVHIHQVELSSGSLVQKAMEVGDSTTERTLPVNSVHWMAPNANTLPENYEVSARAKSLPGLDKKTRQGAVYQPEENTVEAFSTIHGAPVAGVLWHTEAFDFRKSVGADGANSRLLTFMAKAGNAYAAKRTMLDELSTTTRPVKENEVDGLSKVLSKMKIS